MFSFVLILAFSLQLSAVSRGDGPLIHGPVGRRFVCINFSFQPSAISSQPRDASPDDIHFIYEQRTDRHEVTKTQVAVMPRLMASLLKADS